MLFGKYVNKFYIKYFWNFFLGVVLLIFVDIIQLEVPEIVGELKHLSDIGSLTDEIVGQMGLNILLIALGMFVGRFLWRVCILTGAYRISCDLRQDMFNHTLDLSQNYYQKNKVGEIMAYYTNDIDTIQECFGWGTVMLVDAVFLSSATIIKMFNLNWLLTLICLIPLLILCISSYFIDVKMESIYTERQNSFAKMSDYTQEIFTGIKVIKAFVREKIEAVLFKSVNEDCRNKDLQLVRFSALLESIITILIKLMIVIGMSVGAYFLFLHFNDMGIVQISTEDMVEFIMYFDIIIWPMMALGQIISLLSRAKTSLKRISEYLDEEVDVKDEEDCEDLLNVDGSITFNNFTYAYKEGIDVLKNISLRINKGEMIGVIGKVSSGKTTLVSTLLRFDNFEKGKVFIDDKDIMAIKIKSLRNFISFVPQDNFLFSKTIKENISFASKEYSEDQIVDAALFADVHDNIVGFPEGYSTLVSEKGVSLSGGQKQRIAIARAYIKNSPIMIFDDSLSAVDVKTEETILRNIRDLRKDKTTIIVASRPSTVKHMDKIIVLNNGCVEAFDNHDRLMEISLTYKNMVDLQQLKTETEDVE